MFEKLKKWWKKIKFEETKRLLKRESVRCPFCNKLYLPSKISKLQQHRIEDKITVIQCTKCTKEFGVKTFIYNDPSFAIYKVAIKIGKIWS